mgnify:CR=1 FL=1
MKPKALKLPIRAVPQSDDCGCGHFALSAVYKYYGLSPRALRLRALLGTDHATPYGLPYGLRRQIAARFPRMKGTLPHDIFAVLYRHGFQTRIAPSNYANFRRSLRLNLLHGHPALALVDGVAHWVVVSGIDLDGVWIVDSCEYEDENEVCRHTYHLSDTEYQDRRTGEILISRRKNAAERPMSDADFAREYLRATQFWAQALGGKALTALRGLLGA